MLGQEAGGEGSEKSGQRPLGHLIEGGAHYLGALLEGILIDLGNLAGQIVDLDMG